ncbi:MAG: HAMP domain-containing histidine kinase [Erysipelotrichaceae bacterium]|nr:HAMP domain-containing histidine kinase [Erysipelotrichaceae bacterium]
MKKKPSLQLLITGGLLLVAAFILSMTYLFQNYLLDDFYLHHKSRTLMQVAEDVANGIAEEEDINDLLRRSSLNNEVCIYLVGSRSGIASSRDNNNCALHYFGISEIRQILETTVEDGGEHLFKDLTLQFPDGQSTDMVLYAKALNDSQESGFVLVSSVMTPLDSTMATLRSQFWIIAGVVLLATLLLGLLLSRIFLRPFAAIGREAVRLPQGDYDPDNAKSRIREFAELNETLNRANEGIRKADKAKRDLLANVTHDLRTPLTMIIGYGEMIRDFPEDDPQPNAEVIISEAKSLNGLVSDLLDASRTEAGMKLEKETVSLKPFLEEVVRQYEGYCASQNALLQLEMAEECTAEIDPKRMQQVLCNFLNNALHYNDKEEKKILLKAEREGDAVTVSVTDNGEGIAEEDLPLVWERYFKVDREHKRSQQGSGIGLFLAKAILEAHQCPYGVDSKEGEYSRFWFRLPLKAVPEV